MSQPNAPCTVACEKKMRVKVKGKAYAPVLSSKTITRSMKKANVWNVIAASNTLNVSCALPTNHSCANHPGAWQIEDVSLGQSAGHRGRVNAEGS